MNTCILMGRLTGDPELRHTASGVEVTSFTLAVDRRQGGEEKQTDFITVVAWRKTAEFICKYFTKGQQMLLQGSIQTRRYQDKEGNNRTAFEVVAERVHFTGSKAERPAADIPYSAPQEAAAQAPVSNADTGDVTESFFDGDLPL